MIKAGDKMARKSRKHPTPPCVTTYNTAMYLRLSVAKPGGYKSNDSLQNQQQLLENYIAQNPEFTLQKIFTDSGAPGTNFNRPAWRALMQECEQGRINCIIIKDLSRLGRNYLEAGDYLERILPALGVRLIAVNDSYDSQNITNSQRLVFNIKNLVNDVYAKDISRKVIATIRAKQKNGEFVGSRAAYGYSLNHSKLAVNPDTAPIVRRIFEMKAAGLTNGTICKKLNGESIPCPNKYHYLSGLARSDKYANTIWITSTIVSILRNTVYIGYMNSVANMHEAIISQELFDRVNKVKS